MASRRWYNPFVRALLNSPLHGVMSGRTLLLTFTGRKTGHEYTTPISYACDGRTLTLITSRQREWWHNLEGGAKVRLRLRGKVLCGTARVAAVEAPGIIHELETVYRGIPASRAAQLAADTVVLKIDLN
jgi:deazaflavin-dependent oxidoreductase (nitroreductase family)